MATFWKIRVLSLYRSILRIHKQKLTQEQLYLGNKYVQSEFKLHKTANNKQVNNKKLTRRQTNLSRNGRNTTTSFQSKNW
jgi:hypothetical protein